jgi:hypothetical protein
MEQTEMVFDRADLCVLELILKRESNRIQTESLFALAYTDHYAAKVNSLLNRFKTALETNS